MRSERRLASNIVLVLVLVLVLEAGVRGVRVLEGFFSRLHFLELCDDFSENAIYLKLASTSAICSAFIFEPERFSNPSRCIRQLESFEIR